MLVSGAHTTQDRRIRRAAVKKAALSSRVSLLSSLTASSSGSSGSGSTITQESISRPRVRSSKNNVAPKDRRQRMVADSTSVKGKPSPRKSKGVIDVFAFLDKDQSRASLIQKQAKSGPDAIEGGTKYAAHDDSDLESDPRSFHSDSGISINDAGSDHDSPKTSRTFNRKLGTLQEEHVPRQHRPVAEQNHHPRVRPTPQDIEDDHPEWYYRPGSLHSEAAHPIAPNFETPPGILEHQKPSGYDLLASSICSSSNTSPNSVPPLYRRFECLNHRILLQLQDEIAEMEEDLQYMDQADASERAARHGAVAPASRRFDWQWRGSELHARRLELLGRIYLKVEQYSKSLNIKPCQIMVLTCFQTRLFRRFSG
jgi:hypothetical protein